VALRRLGALARRPELLPDPDAAQRWKSHLHSVSVEGIPLTPTGPAPRPGVVSLRDAFMAADDWLIVRTTRRSVDELVGQYGLTEVLPDAFQRPAQWRVIVPEQTGSGWAFRLYDESLEPIGELRPDPSHGYVTRGGVELLAGGISPAGLIPSAR
jgi:hypothetical protein